MKYFFDTFALFEIIKKNKAYERFLDEEIVTSSLNIGELYYGLLREFGEKTANEWFRVLRQSAIGASIDSIVSAMKFKFRNRKKKFSFIDCVGYVLAKENSLLFLTGDKEFEGMPNTEFVK